MLQAVCEREAVKHKIVVLSFSQQGAAVSQG